MVNQLQSDTMIGFTIHLSKLLSRAAADLEESKLHFQELINAVKSETQTADEQAINNLSSKRQELLNQVETLQKNYQVTANSCYEQSNRLNQAVKSISSNYLSQDNIDFGQQVYQIVAHELDLDRKVKAINTLAATVAGDLQNQLDVSISHESIRKTANQYLSLLGDDLQIIIAEINAAKAVADQLIQLGGQSV